MHNFATPRLRRSSTPAARVVQLIEPQPARKPDVPLSPPDSPPLREKALRGAVRPRRPHRRGAVRPRRPHRRGAVRPRSGGPDCLCGARLTATSAGAKGSTGRFARQSQIRYQRAIATAHPTSASNVVFAPSGAGWGGGGWSVSVPARAIRNILLARQSRHRRSGLGIPEGSDSPLVTLDTRPNRLWVACAAAQVAVCCTSTTIDRVAAPLRPKGS